MPLPDYHDRVYQAFLLLAELRGYFSRPANKAEADYEKRCRESTEQLKEVLYEEIDHATT